MWYFTSRVFIGSVTHSHCVGSGGTRGMMDTFHQTGVDEEARPQQCVHDKRAC